MCVFEQDLRGKVHLAVMGVDGEDAGVPLCVRRKARDVGVVLTGAEWRGLPVAAQERLVAMPVRDALERRTYATLLEWMLRTFSTAPFRPSRVPEEPPATLPWHLEEAPSVLAPVLDEHALSWRALSPDARFALLHALALGRHDAALSALRDSPSACLGAPCMLT